MAGATGEGGALTGRVAVVTGSDSVAGRAAAITLGAEGAAVLCVGGEQAARAISAGGGRALSLDADMAEMDGGLRAIEVAQSEFGRLDILCNAAGISIARSAGSGGILELGPEDFYASVRRGLRATFTTTRFAAAAFRSQRSGRIVNITSDDGLGTPLSAALAMVSEGIVGMTRTVARDLGKYGVTCNAVVADDPPAAAALAATLCTDALSGVNGRTLGARDGSIFLYGEPEIVAGVHMWDGLGLDDLDSLVPATLLPTIGRGGP